MFLGIVTIGLAFSTIVVKWFTTVAHTRLQSKLAEVAESHSRIRQRLKLALSAASITDAEISKLQRSIKTKKRKIHTLEGELGKLESDAESSAAIARQKLALAEEM